MKILGLISILRGKVENDRNWLGIMYGSEAVKVVVADGSNVEVTDLRDFYTTTFQLTPTPVNLH
jgi:hypothetical protein